MSKARGHKPGAAHHWMGDGTHAERVKPRGRWRVVKGGVLVGSTNDHQRAVRLCDALGGTLEGVSVQDGTQQVRLAV